MNSKRRSTHQPITSSTSTRTIISSLPTGSIKLPRSQWKPQIFITIPMPTSPSTRWSIPISTLNPKNSLINLSIKMSWCTIRLSSPSQMSPPMSPTPMSHRPRINHTPTKSTLRSKRRDTVPKSIKSTSKILIIMPNYQLRFLICNLKKVSWKEHTWLRSSNISKSLLN